MAWQDWFGIKQDKDITAEEKKAAQKRTMERAEKSGLLKEEYKQSTEQNRPGRPNFEKPKPRW